MFGFLKNRAENADSAFASLRTDDDVRHALERSHSGPVLVFKHSASCGTSLFVRRQIEALTEESDPPVFEVVVQKSRALSQQMAADFGIRHESPQAILVVDGQPVWNASHGSITTQAVRDAAANSGRPA